MRSLISTMLAVVVIVLTDGDLAIGLITFLAVWVIPARDRRTLSAERRYRMRQTEKRCGKQPRNRFLNADFHYPLDKDENV